MTARTSAMLLPVAVATLCAVGVALGAPMLAGNPAGRADTRQVLRTASNMTSAPEALLPLDEAGARAANARQPFVGGEFPPAPPFRFAGDTADAARAVDCLAAAALYEAGDDADGQRAVVQVVLNRARHPAYPSSVCGVVFQGSERRTGCQFTFTCDGSLRRVYTPQAWERARGLAIAAIAGEVDARVGLATHYHTDWVRPYWSSGLDKLAQVGTHLFFRWQGFWGTPRALRAHGGREPQIGQLAAYSDVHRGGETIASTSHLLTETTLNQEDITAAANAAVRQILSGPTRQLGDALIIQLDPATGASSFPAVAAQLCGERSYCKVMGWTDTALLPDGEALTDAQRAGMSFSYLVNRSAGLQRSLWNCGQFPRENARECMRR